MRQEKQCAKSTASHESWKLAYSQGHSAVTASINQTFSGVMGGALRERGRTAGCPTDSARHEEGASDIFSNLFQYYGRSISPFRLIPAQDF